jgi:hypothetical protein
MRVTVHSIMFQASTQKRTKTLAAAECLAGKLYFLMLMDISSFPGEALCTLSRRCAIIIVCKWDGSMCNKRLSSLIVGD